MVFLVSKNNTIDYKDIKSLSITIVKTITYKHKSVECLRPRHSSNSYGLPPLPYQIP